MSIATRLQHAIRERDISIREFQRQMAATDADGTSYPAINRALHGRGTPSVRFLEVAADLLNVRRAWLMAGDGDMSEHRAAEAAARFGLADWFAGYVPWLELDVWLYEIERLDLSNRAREAFYRLALTFFDAITILGIGEIATPAGQPEYRPSPSLRDAMGLHVSSWLGLLTSWVEENGGATVAKQIEAHVADLEQRFVGSVPAMEVTWQHHFRLPESRDSGEQAAREAATKLLRRVAARRKPLDAQKEVGISQGSFVRTTASRSARTRASSESMPSSTDARGTLPAPIAKRTGRRQSAK